MGKSVKSSLANIRAGWINLTSSCNNRCRLCFKENDFSLAEKTIETESAKKVIDFFAALKIENCAFIGGEPTLHPSLPELAKYAKRSGIKFIHLVTNGRRLSDKLYMDQIAQNVDAIAFSLYSSNTSTHNSITGVDSWQETVAGILNSIDRNIFTSVNVVVHERNRETIPSTVKTLLGWNLSEIVITSAKPRLIDGRLDSSEALDPQVFAKLIEECYIDDKRLRFNFKRPLCLMDRDLLATLAVQGKVSFQCQIQTGSGLTVDVDGNILPCNTIAVPHTQLVKDGHLLIEPDTFLRSYSKMTKDIRKTYFPKKPTSCGKCLLWRFCKNGCPLVWKAFGLEGRINPWTE